MQERWFVRRIGPLAIVPILVLGSTSNCAQSPQLAQLQTSEGAPGATVVITGEEFGTDLSQVTVAFGRSSPVNPVLCSDGRIVVQVPTDAVSGEVLVTVLKKKQEDAGAFRILPMSRLEPTTGSVGSVVTIFGKNLGYTIPAGARVTFQGGNAQIRRWSPSAVIVAVPAQARTGAVTLLTAGKAQNVGSFTVLAKQAKPDPPAIGETASRQSAPSSDPMKSNDPSPTAPSIAVPPSNYASAQTARANAPTDGHSAAASTSPNAATQPEQKMQSQPQQQSAQGQQQQLQQQTQGEAPSSPTKAIITPVQAPVASLVLIQGSGFGDAQGKVTSPGASKQASEAKWDVKSWTQVAIIATVPEDAAFGKTTLTIIPSGNLPSQNVEFTKQNMTPISGPPGSVVKINGTGFGAQGESTIKFGNRQATSVKQWADDEIDVAVPESLTAGNYNVELDLSAQNGSTVAHQEGKFAVTNPADAWSDDDEVPVDINFVGGFEEGIQSAQAQAYNPFLAVYGRRMFGDSSKPLHSLGPLFNIRLISAPSTTSTDNIVSVFTNPSGAITSTKLSAVGSAVDVNLGAEFGLWKSHSRQTSIDFILGGGAVTPIQANTENSAFTMPAFGTVECTDLQSRLAKILTRPIYANIVAEPSTTTSATACFENKAASTSGNPTAVSTLVWATPNQPNFFGRVFGGFRLMNRYFYQSSGQHTCDRDNPCERGYVDVMGGQDASITGGVMRHLVLTIDAMHPLPVPSVNYLYLFGSISKRFEGLPEQPPLVLQSTTPPSSGPSASTLVLPLQQPDRDFYRIGIGVRLDKIFSALAASKNSPASTQVSGGGATAK